jgi:hypothetical protein
MLDLTNQRFSRLVAQWPEVDTLERAVVPTAAMEPIKPQSKAYPAAEAAHRR